MHVQKSGTFYDVYVKNDTYYQKMLNLNNANDMSFNDYMNKIQASIPELTNVSMGDIEINVLPESSVDKSSSNTDDVSDDIIGITTSHYYYEADETMGAGVLTSENMIFNITPNKQSVSSVIDKLQTIYKDDSKLSSTVNRYSNPETYVNDFLKSGTDENGDKIYTISVLDNPLAYAMANLNCELTGQKLGDIAEGKCLFVVESIKEMLKKLAEEKKRENEEALLKTKTSETSDADMTTVEKTT